MQLMSWAVARLGSRFSLLFEPYQQRIRHSALGRFLDEPLDLMVGLVGPDGTERALPFSTRGKRFYHLEQFERPNSITFRAYCTKYNLQFEFNIHSVFYPQDEKLCLMPAFYLEMRVCPVDRIRWFKSPEQMPETVDLFIRVRRPNTQVDITEGAIHLAYQNRLTPTREDAQTVPQVPTVARQVQVQERIVSLNPDTVVDQEGHGLKLTIPVAESGSGIKWRLVWGAYCSEPILEIVDAESKKTQTGKLRYTQYWNSLEEVISDAIEHRDERLTYSRNFEKMLAQAPLRAAQRHLLNQTFQQFLSNTFWCQLTDEQGNQMPWFSTWDGNSLHHGVLDVEYNISMWYLSVWPDLLKIQFSQWAKRLKLHGPSEGAYLPHDFGVGLRLTGQAYPHAMPVEENANFLLLLQTYAHWTGDLSPVRENVQLIEKLAKYLVWTDSDHSSFPSEGVANAIDDANPALQFAPKQTYLAIKRVMALNAVVDLLTQVGQVDLVKHIEPTLEQQIHEIERKAWRDDHYAVCVDCEQTTVTDAWSDQPLPYDKISGGDGYSIYTGNGLLLPLMANQPIFLDRYRLFSDISNTIRETNGPYGCGHTSEEPTHVWVSQNLWRDHLARYLGITGPAWAQGYWDMQVACNTAGQTLGFCDTYIGNNLSFHPRGATAFGYLLSYPRLVIDRLAKDGTEIYVNPDRYYSQRWPLLALADWKAGKIPVCVVDQQLKKTRVFIENTVDPVIVRGQEESSIEDQGEELIG